MSSCSCATYFVHEDRSSRNGGAAGKRGVQSLCVWLNDVGVVCDEAMHTTLFIMCTFLI
jgi:hypothetical protein